MVCIKEEVDLGGEHRGPEGRWRRYGLSGGVVGVASGQVSRPG